MTDPTPVPTEPTAPAPTEPQGDPADLGESGRKALDAERKRATAAERETKALKARLDELEKANLSDLEKAQRTATEATTRLTQYEKRALRMEAALAANLSVDDVDRLRGETAEELLADAQSLAERLGSKQSPSTPKPDLTQGGRREPGQGSTPAQDFAAFMRAQTG